MEANIQKQEPTTDILSIISSATDEQLKQLIETVTREAATRALMQVKIHETKIHDIQQELETSTAKIEQMQKAQDDFIEKSNYFYQIRQSQEYVNLTNLGRKIIPNISNIRTKKLLRWAGILQQNEHIPYQNYLQGKEPLVQQQKGVNGHGYEYLYYLYHAERAWKLIDRKLKEAGLLTGFKSIKTTSELHSFIDNWCDIQ
ncbi:MAG: hypothetical protein LCH52_08485 [Bacteroidetes bacterium]|nr:hypothetical protein [Bacteroidota bacterium]